MNILNKKSGFILCVSLLMPGALYAMDAVKSAKWSVLTRFYLKRPNDRRLSDGFVEEDIRYVPDSRLSACFFEGAMQYAIDAQGNASNADSAPNPGQFNENARGEYADYSVDLSMKKAELDGAGEITRLVYEYFVLHRYTRESTTIAQGPDPLEINRVNGSSSNGWVTIMIDGAPPFDLCLTADIYDVEKK